MEEYQHKKLQVLVAHRNQISQGDQLATDSEKKKRKKKE